MKGTLRGDFSRLFDPGKRYSSVRLQQGRVLLDADWNAQADITGDRIATATADVVGEGGAPAGEAGFGLCADSGVETGPGRHFVVLGGPEGAVWDEPPASEAGFTLEAKLLPRGDGTVVSRWVAASGGFKLADQLVIEEGRLGFRRPASRRSGGETLAAEEPLALGEVRHVAVSCRDEAVTLYVDGEAVAEGDGLGAAAPLAENSFLVGASLRENQPQEELDAVFLELRLWGVRRTPEEVRETSGRSVGRKEPGLLGLWTFDEGSGSAVRDHTLHCNHGALHGSEEPPRWTFLEPELSAGRYYVEGTLCVNEETVPFGEQPDYPGAVFPEAAGHYLFYLDVWERSVSALEDPELVEVALGGATTTTRSKTVAQVKVVPLAAEPAPEDGAEAIPEWRDLRDGARRRGRLRAQRRLSPGAFLDNYLYRVEVHHGGGAYPRRYAGRRGEERPPAEAASACRPGEGERSIVLDAWQEGWLPGQPIELYSPGGAGAAPGQLAVVEAVDPEGASLVLDRDLGSLSEREDLEVRRLASFKWSRNNSAECYPITGYAEGGRSLALGRTVHGELCLRSGAWVEVVDDVSTLRREPGHLCQVGKLEADRQQLFLEQSPPEGVGTDASRHPLLRVWDQEELDKDLPLQGVVVARSDRWLPLEAGIEVVFEGDGSHDSGDYWWMPSRSVLQDVEWPRDPERRPLPIAPHGVDHAYAPVALLSRDENGFRLHDLRRTFKPLVAGAVSKAGDVMEGALEVRDDVKITGDLEVEGQARVGGLYGRLCSHGIVDTEHLVDGAVTAEKLAAEVGVVPAGFSILGPTAESPPGYEYTGSQQTMFTDEPVWIDRLEIPDFPPGALRAAAVGEKVLLFHESGEVWEYDSWRNTWSRRLEMPMPRRRFAVAAVGGKVYLAGGTDNIGRCRNNTFEYDPVIGEWQEVSPMLVGRSDFSLVAYGDVLHALGGKRNFLGMRPVTRRHEAYDPARDTWVKKSSLPVARCRHAAAAFGNRISVVGGERRFFFRLFGSYFTALQQQYHPATDGWLVHHEPLTSARADLGLVEIFGKLYAVGGRSPLGKVADCDRFDPATDRWKAQTPLHEAVPAPGVAAVRGALYVVGARRAPDAEGVLVEECRFANRFFIHRRKVEPGYFAADEDVEELPAFEPEIPPFEPAPFEAEAPSEDDESR